MSSLKKIALLLGDIGTLYLSLAVTILVRYPAADFGFYFKDHFSPFSMVFIVWVAVFSLSNLYQFKDFQSRAILFKRLTAAVFISGIASAIVFYLFGNFFQLTPKINLLIFAGVFLILNYLWRILIIKLFTAGSIKIMLLGDAPLLNEMSVYLTENPHAGYQIAEQIGDLKGKSAAALAQIIREGKISTVIIQPSLARDFSNLKLIFRLLPEEVNLMNAWDFYEILFEKVPLKDLDENWFIEKISTRRPFYDALKRGLDIVLSLIFGAIFLPFGLIFALAVKINSAGPAIFKQTRIGKNGKPFTLYKFRIMIVNHSGSPWTTKHDERLTLVGRILNFTHLNEIPQLWNILRGDMSFTGPRPESRDLAQIYQQLPYYDIRHIVKPGVSGWAQINYKPSASLEEAYEKLCYDIYYVKNRSIFLDLNIIFKTIKYVFVSHF